MESSLMVMEAFEGHEDKFTYDIVGHSGEEPAIPFVVGGGASKRGQGRVGTGRGEPRNEKERLEVLREIHAHAQVGNRFGLVRTYMGRGAGPFCTGTIGVTRRVSRERLHFGRCVLPEARLLAAHRS